MNCPHCGAEESDESDADIQVFQCGTEIIENEWQSIPSDCYCRQISQLKAELSQCVRRDDPRLKEALELLLSADEEPCQHYADGMIKKAGDKLQSIIEGK